MSIRSMATPSSLPKLTTKSAALLALLGVAAGCSATPGAAPADVGNMAYPTPLPQGVVSRTAVSAPTFDTGNMAYPAPLPQGNLATTRLQ